MSCGACLAQRRVCPCGVSTEVFILYYYIANARAHAHILLCVEKKFVLRVQKVD